MKLQKVLMQKYELLTTQYDPETLMNIIAEADPAMALEYLFEVGADTFVGRFGKDAGAVYIWYWLAEQLPLDFLRLAFWTHINDSAVLAGGTFTPMHFARLINIIDEMLSQFRSKDVYAALASFFGADGLNSFVSFVFKKQAVKRGNYDSCDVDTHGPLFGLTLFPYGLDNGHTENKEGCASPFTQ